MSFEKTPKDLHPKTVFSSKCDFILGAHNLSQIPDHNLPEIAFLGASNIGKSSLINALVGKKIAITSGTPGRTRQLNFFNIGNYFMLVDMPGYGFAKAREKHIAHWQGNAAQYLLDRKNLKRLFLLIDPTKGLKEADLDAIDFFNENAIQFQIILTKIDKISKKELEIAKKKIEERSQIWPASFPEILSVSASKGYNIFDLQNSIIEIIKQ